MPNLDDFGDLIEGGADWISDAVGGPLKDLASNEWGVYLIRAVAGSFSAALAPILGPQLASVAWALPGLLKGERFDKAWLEEFSFRVQGVAEWLGVEYGKQLIEQLHSASEELMAESREAFGDLPVDEAVKRLNLDIANFAQRLGIREDVAARIVALARRMAPPQVERYDLETGKRKPLVSIREAIGIVGTSAAGTVRVAMADWHTEGSMLQWMRSIP